MSKMYSHDIFGNTTHDFMPTNDFYAFDKPGKKKTKTGKKAKKRERKLAKKLKKARKIIKVQEDMLRENNSSMTWWQTAIIESLPKVIDLLDSTKRNKH